MSSRFRFRCEVSVKFSVRFRFRVRVRYRVLKLGSCFVYPSMHSGWSQVQVGIMLQFVRGLGSRVAVVP